jgi:hypothetical protein
MSGEHVEVVSGGGVRALAGSVRMSSAPKACSRMRRSSDMDAGMVRMSL